ncbi:hypothetical protein D3P08_06165 [Paenibacillus nanensis]|uniref:Dynamin N-terminal domain-containing protein n=1 Tax=Paenibacillus nanensis TaxID=393251 RepID=A0A3A1VFL7_9BACL|nr:dynamin family protein [Paenibacillus nanensis]RIX59708.1 hypothetical protein D3P08_06165 [Paenibacillus nanensis]
MLERYAETKKYLLSFIDELKNADSVDQQLLTNSTLQDEAVRLEKGDFKIALVAPFSAGKSTFINSIIGKDLLSMDIRAETSVITKISYSEQIRIEISYIHSPKIDVVETDEEGQPLNYHSCKEMLKRITTVRDETNEERIRQVVVYCPLDICRDNVEIIDTPGLFSRHEKHEAITNNIIPQVNAVIFMIDPDSVGEEHFTSKIRNYVQSAKTSSLEEDGRHIFFVINKIDMFDPSDIAKAREELEGVLRGIIRNPNIHEVSAYYGMRGKQLYSGDLPITEIQRDRKIKIPDPLEPEFPISGRLLSEEHAPNIIQFSQIRQLELSLGEYLQSKNKYLITDVISSIRSILSDSVNKLRFEVKEIQSTLQEDKSVYIGKIDMLKEEIEDLKVQTLEQINGLVKRRIVGGLEGSGIEDEVSDEVSGLLVDVTKDFERELYKKWTKAKVSIDRSNAEETVQSLFLEAEEFLVLKVKELVRHSFLMVKDIISGLIGDIQVQLDVVTERMEEAEFKNLGSKMNRIGNLNVENLVGVTMNKIEREFSSILVSVAKDCQQRVEEAGNASTSQVKVKGFWNWVKGWFGAEDYEEKFDLHRFKKELDVVITDLTDSMNVKLQQSQVAIVSPIMEMANQIVKDINGEVGKIITNVVKIKQNVLADLRKEMNKNEDEKEAAVGTKMQLISKVREIVNRFESRISTLLEGGASTDELSEQSAVHS